MIMFVVFIWVMVFFVMFVSCVFICVGVLGCNLLIYGLFFWLICSFLVMNVICLLLLKGWKWFVIFWWLNWWWFIVIKSCGGCIVIWLIKSGRIKFGWGWIWFIILWEFVKWEWMIFWLWIFNCVFEVLMG